MERGDFGFHLLRRAEDVAVVLRERTHAHDAVQRTGLFIAMATTELGIPDRQITIRMQAGVVDLHMARAVHRLDRIGALLGLREEHVLLVVVPVPGLLPQADVKDLRTAHFLIAAVLVDARSEEHTSELQSLMRTSFALFSFQK